MPGSSPKFTTPRDNTDIQHDMGTRSRLRRSTWLILVGLVFMVAFAALGRDSRAALSPGKPLVFRRPSSWQLTEAKLHWRAGRVEEAETMLEQALHEDPTDVALATWLIDIRLQRERYKEAITLLKEYAHFSTKKRNLYFRLGVAHAKLKSYKNALGYYQRALELDPYLKRAYVDVAKIRIQQRFLYDAKSTLKRLLQIDPDNQDGRDHLEMVERLIQSDKYNVWRRENVLIHFHDHKLVSAIEQFYPLIQAHRVNLEDKLKYSIPLIHIKVVDKIERHFNPPTFYDDLEDAIMITRKTLENGDHVAFSHELAWYYLTRMTRKNLPLWLHEGLCLMESRPAFLDAKPLRTTRVKWSDLDHSMTMEKRFLEFDQISKLDPSIEESLRGAYTIVRFLLESYGWDTMRLILAEYRGGKTRFEPTCEKILHIDFESLVAKYTTYAISNYFFHSTGEISSSAPAWR